MTPLPNEIFTPLLRLSYVRPPHTQVTGARHMIDCIFLLATLAFFAAALGYTAGCEHLRGGKPDDGKLNGGKLNA